MGSCLHNAIKNSLNPSYHRHKGAEESSLKGFGIQFLPQTHTAPTRFENRHIMRPEESLRFFQGEHSPI